MKQILKNVLSSAAFLLGLVLLMALLSPVALPKNNRADFGMEEPGAHGILGEPENSIDVVILGDSETYCAFVPLQLWEDHGMSAYVFGTNTQRLFETHLYLTRILEHQSPRVVILETNALYTDSGYGRVAAAEVGGYFPLFRYHDRWKSLHLTDFFTVPNYTFRNSFRGFELRTGAVPADTEGYMEPGDHQNPFPGKNRLLLARICALCRKAGAELILVSSPSTANWDMGRHNSVAAFAEKLGVTYIDMNTLQQEIPIDWQQDTLDAGDHLNYYGARKATDWLGQYLCSHYDLPDHRDDAAYADWQQALEAFHQALAENGLE